MTGIVNLLTNASGNAGVDIVGEWKTWYGGPGDFWVSGDLGGGTVHLEATLSDVTSSPIAINCVDGTFIVDTSPTVASITKFLLGHGTKIRAVLEETKSNSSGVMIVVNN